MSKVVVFLAEGFEECEALLVVDLLKRAKIAVIMASVSDSLEVASSHNVKVLANSFAQDIDYSNVDMIVLPGGMPGTLNLGKSDFVRDKCTEFAENKKLAAICAAPSILGSLGILNGKRGTCYPGFEDKLKGCSVSYSGVCVDGNIITGRALGSAIDFSLELIKALEGEKSAENVAATICYES